LSSFKQIPLKWLIGLSVVFLLIILAVGLKPKGMRFGNRVSWIKDRPGVRFSRLGIAYTRPLGDLTLPQNSEADGFSIEIAMKPAGYRGRRFQFILVLHDGDDSEQLVVAQYHSWLIVMNGDDYAYKKKIKRISVDAASPSPITRFVTLTSGEEGTRIFFDGKPVATEKELRLRIPIGNQTRIVVGNSVYGRHPWHGDIYGLALYNYPLASQKVAHHFDCWSKEGRFLFAGRDNPFALYFFDETGGAEVRDHSGANRHLEIPLMMQVLKRRILAPPWIDFRLDSGFISDALVNFTGFIPFGFILFATLLKFGPAIEKHAFLVTIALCFSVSLSLEIAQAWMPSRSSSMLDLILNTLGGLAGTTLCRFFRRRSKIRWLV